jgi:hypothetical protein
VSRPLSRCRGRYRDVEAAIELSKPLSRYRGRCRSGKAAVTVSRLPSRCEAAVEVSRLLSRCQGRCQGVKAAVEVSKPLSRCRSRCRSGKAAVEVFKAGEPTVSLDYVIIIIAQEKLPLSSSIFNNFMIWHQLSLYLTRILTTVQGWRISLVSGSMRRG